VPRSVADGRWLLNVSVTVPGEPAPRQQTSPVLHDRTYVQIVPVFERNREVTVEVASFEQVGARRIGLARWRFVLVRDDG